MKNFTQELKDILKEDPGAPILSPDEVRSRANTMVILTNEAPRELLALAGPTRKAILLNYKPLMITFPDQRGVYKVQPDDIVFENHHSGRDVTEAGSQETSRERRTTFRGCPGFRSLGQDGDAGIPAGGSIH